MRIFRIKDDYIAYKGLTVICNCSETDMVKHLKKENKSAINGLELTGADGRTIELERGNRRVYYIWISKLDLTSKTIALTLHEIFHYITYQLGNLGIVLTKDTTEVFAYYISYMTHVLIDDILSKIGGEKHGKRTRSHR